MLVHELITILSGCDQNATVLTVSPKIMPWEAIRVEEGNTGMEYPHATFMDYDSPKIKRKLWSARMGTVKTVLIS